MRRTAILLPTLLLIVLVGYAYLKIQKSSVKIDLKADYEISAVRLFNEFQLIENSSNAKYKSKVLEVTGKVKEVIPTIDGGVTVVLDAENPLFGVSCKLQKREIPHSNRIQIGDEIVITGVCKGIFMDVRIENCSIN